MCITYVYINPLAKTANDYQLIVINNRDEYLNRPSSQADWENGILAGRDEKDPNNRGGTWFGVNELGRVGILVSILQPAASSNPLAPSRGSLVNDFLKSNVGAWEYAKNLSEHAHVYNGFQLILIDRKTTDSNSRHFDLITYMNGSRDNVVEVLKPGIYGFGNSPRNSPFSKVHYGRRRFQHVLIDTLDTLHSKEQLIEHFLDILTDKKRHFPDAQMQSQCDEPAELLCNLSSIFVEYPKDYGYGTRCHSIFLIDGLDQATFFEKSMLPDIDTSTGQFVWDTKTVTFHV